MLQKLSDMKSVLRAVTAAAVLGSASMGAMACGSEPYIGEVCTFASNYCPKGFVQADGSLLRISSNPALFSLLGNFHGGDGRTNFAVPNLRGRTVVGAIGALMGSPLPPPDVPFVIIGQKLGQTEVTLTANQIPQHYISTQIPANAFTGTATVNLSNGSVSGQRITGSVTVEGLNGDAAPAGGVNVPTATANTVGKNNLSLQFYPSGTTKIALPSNHNLGVTGGTISGTAAGTVTMPTDNVYLNNNGVAGVVSPTAVPTMQPSLGLLQCIATQGIFPQKP